MKPEYADRILSGEKKFEFRKSIFKNDLVKTVVIYATMPVGKVVGEFEIEEVLSERPSQLWEATKAYAGITKVFFEQYFHGRDTGYAIRVKTVKRYRRPLDLAGCGNTSLRSHPKGQFKRC
uniref:ASCH domain-containing protein n=1 Tax=Caballeronia sp. LjRoot34 TaxID=3342325 RepID=UPI003F5077C1